MKSLDELIIKLQEQNPPWASVSQITSSLNQLPSIKVEDFQSLLQAAHDLLVIFDTTRRAALLRAIRVCMKDVSHCKLLLSEEVHWLVMISLERESSSQFNMERVQALKLMDKFRRVSPEVYPITFVRSLVAIGNSKEDSLRKLSLDSLVELAMVNPVLVATATGFNTLLEAVLDPALKDCSEKILHVSLHLLGDPSTRKLLANCIDLKVLLAPFTDLDSDPSELSVRWECAKFAFVTIMKTWVGIFYLTADELALPLLVKMLNDAKIPFSNQEVLLDCFADVLRPIVFKIHDVKEIRMFQAPQSSLHTEQHNHQAVFESDMNKSQSSFQTANKQSAKTNAKTVTEPPAANSSNRPFSISSLFSSRGSVVNFRRGSVKTTISQSNSAGNLTKLDKSFDNQKSSLHDVAPEESPSVNKIDTDPVFNLIDNYAAVLCCSFLHVDLLHCLFNLALESSSAIAEKSRKLLVELMRVLSIALPEKACADLLTNPALIDIASVVYPNKLFHKAHKASLILWDLASAFSNLPCVRRLNPLTDNSESSLLHKMKFSQSITSANSRSNIHPLPINSIRDISEEIICVPSPSLGKFDKVNSIRDISGSLLMVLAPHVEKGEFIKQMDQSRVIGKEGKEPFKWEWILINDMLQHSFQHSERLQEALKTKWIKRLSGFYRCSTDEKGYFANLEWDGTNFHYLECACNLYAVLLRDDAGMMFLTSDRRGMLFNEMSNELEQLTAASSQRMFSPHSTSRNVFRNTGCLVSMSREFFTLLGKIVCIPGSRKLLDHTNIFDHLSKLGQYQSLDYLSRLVLTALSFSDNGVLSKHLFYLWGGTCSAELRFYFHSLLRFMQFSPKCSSNKWFIEAIVNQLLLDDSDEVLIAALNEAIQDKNNLKVVLSKKPNFFGSPDLKDILIRFTAISEGLSMLRNNNWLEGAIDEWKSIGCKQYVINVEERLSKSLFAPESFISSRLPSNVTPIPVSLPVHIQLSKLDTSAATNIESKSMKIHNKGNEGFIPDLHGILRIPWHIEVKVSSQPNENLNHSEYLKIDTFPDVSDIPSPLNYEVTFDNNRIIKVRGILLDNKGFPNGKAISPTALISSTLLIGNYSLSKSGRLQCCSELPLRKRASTNSTKEATQASNSNRNFSGTNSSNFGTENSQDFDLPFSANHENYCDWSYCRPAHRHGGCIELDGGKFGITIAGDPIMFIFSRRSPAIQVQRNSISFDNLSSLRSGKQGQVDAPFDANRNNRMDSSRLGDSIYLVEIVYYMKMETGQALFVPMPRNLYGELVRTTEGCAELSNRHIIFDLVHSARTVYEQIHKPIVNYNSASDSQKLNTLELRSALWSLAHIGSTELGFAALTAVDPAFVEWCIQCIQCCNYYNIRGTFFYLLGLISRTMQGEKKLIQNQWSCASRVTSAVAIPTKVNILFPKISMTSNDTSIIAPGMRRTSLTLSRLNVVQTPTMPYLNNISIASSVKVLTPFLQSGSISQEQEILNLILKMPGVILYRECKARLYALRDANNESFSNRSLYLDVLNILDSANFKLAARRDIMDLFLQGAKLRRQFTKVDEKVH